VDATPAMRPNDAYPNVFAEKLKKVEDKLTGNRKDDEQDDERPLVVAQQQQPVDLRHGRNDNEREARAVEDVTGKARRRAKHHGNEAERQDDVERVRKAFG